ncbi:MAG: FkbM family methyltransferase [Bacteroidales bacterium]|nr:FkbM family methyltransferase [Bacteroidales bacterium]
MDIKDIARNILISLHFDLTKNLKYDRLTKQIMKQIIKSGSNCIDVGCHKGEMLESILKLAPNGKHFAFEPIPRFYKHLQNHFKDKATIYPYALAEESGNSTFNYVKNAPAYSGLKKRKYNIENPEIEEITVEIKSLDELITSDTKIDFIKIDVEGGEFDVLKGATQLLKSSKPYIIFECGLGASEYYQTNPETLFNFLNNETDLKISLLQNFINNKDSLTSEEFVRYFNENSEYYFIAHP